jgi:membrane-associated protease RseP (regulator of RpoE activity)
MGVMTRELRTAVVLFLLTLFSMFWTGANWAGVDTDHAPLSALLEGYRFALPLMAILLAHELGHYFAARIHGVDTSPPYFIPMPFSLIGTFGAVIRMRGAIRLRNALFDIGAAGPLSGLVVALPVLVYGIATSQVEPLRADVTYFVEGRSLLYVGLVYALKGPIPEGADIMLTPTALAGWAGLLVTMINLVPVGQLDGGHVAYALFGQKQDQYSRWARRALLVIALGISLGAAAFSLSQGTRGEPLSAALLRGSHWLIWWALLAGMARFTGENHPPTEPSTLSRGRRVLAWLTLGLFVLLFMPTWVRMTEPAPDAQAQAALRAGTRSPR